MISKKFIREVSHNPYLTDSEKFDIFLSKNRGLAIQHQKFPCPQCGNFASHKVLRSTYRKRLCGVCGYSFDKIQNPGYTTRSKLQSKTS